MADPVDFDVLILGAGIAGLTAGYHISTRFPQISFKVVEARNRVGGRVLSTQMLGTNGKMSTFDLGGQWLGPVQTDLIQLMEELGLSDKLYKQYVTGKKVCWMSPNRLVNYTTELPFLNPVAYFEAFTFMRKVDEYAKELYIDNPFMKNPSLAYYLDSITAEVFIRQNVSNLELREIIRIGMRSVYGLESSQISALSVILDGKASGSLKNVFTSSETGSQKMKLDGGMHQVCDRLAAVIGEENIFLDSPVLEIIQSQGFVDVITSKQKFRVKKVISSIPPPELLKIKMSPTLSPRRVETLQSLLMGNLTKFIVTYENPFWREKGFSGETVCYGGESGQMADEILVGPISVTLDHTLPDGTPSLVGFIGGSQTILWSSCEPEQLKQVVLSNLAKMFGDEALNPLDYRYINWASERWSGGSGCSIQPGVGRFWTPSLRQPHGNIHLAGTETAQRSSGYLSGAVQSGRRAAVEVLYALGKYNMKDAPILALTCFGPSGKARRWTVKWLTASDHLTTQLPSSVRYWKYLAILGMGFLIYKTLLRKNFTFRISNAFYKFARK